MACGGMSWRNVVSGVEFPGDNDSYLRWTTMHADGYVINIQRGLNASDARLHRASCHWINGVPPRGDGFVGSYIKVCSDSLADLDTWASERVRSKIRPCGTCRPGMPGAAILGVPAREFRDERLRRGASAAGTVPAATAADHHGAYRQQGVAHGEGAMTEVEAEADRLVEACRPLPTRQWKYEEHDYMTNVLLTVLDLQMRNVTVERSIRHYRDCRWTEIRTLEHLEDLLGRFPDDKEGNRQVAQYLWGNDHWTRAGWLRGLAVFLAVENLRTNDALRAWAQRSDYQKDFAGRVRYLGPAAYHWLVMRLGVDTVKPDVHLRRFVEDVVGHPITDGELIKAVTQAARRLGRSPRELDAAIWERAALGVKP
jgi:hypothetical protein